MKSLIKTVKFQCLLLILSTAICVPFKAIAGGGSTGGGDLECDAKIQDITTNIQTWVTNKGERSGTRLDLSSSVHPKTHTAYTFSQYETSMLDLLKKPVDANCVSQGDSAYPVEVGNSAKICKTFVDAKGIHMLCDRVLFMGLDADDRIKQVHHELAINVAGLEPDTGSISTYKISKQLSAFIASVSERRLVVMTEKPKEYVQVGDTEKITDGRDLYMSQADAIKYCASNGQHLPSARELAQLATSMGATGISETAKDGYHQVNAKNADGKVDSFYFSYAGYKRPSGNLGNHWFWSSSVDLSDPKVELVFSGDNGDVGVDPRDDYYYGVNPFRCARGQ